MTSPVCQYTVPMSFDPSFSSPARAQQTSYPIFDPQSPFVKQGATHGAGIPGSVDGRLRAKLTGSGTNGGFLVSPLVKLGPGGAPRYEAGGYLPESPIIANASDAHWNGLAGLGMHDAGVDFDFQVDDLSAAYGASPSKFPRLGLSGGSRIASSSIPMLVPDRPPPTMMPSMIPSSAKKPRSVSGLGTPLSAMRARRMRQVTHDSSTIPVSPLAHSKKPVQGPTLPSSAPLLRAVSASAAFMSAPTFQQDRNVSTSTASTWGEVMSPHLYPDGSLGFPVDNQPLDYTSYANAAMLDTPALEQSLASPALSTGRSPPCTPQAHQGLFYTSPTSSQGTFSQSGRYDEDQPGYTIHGQMGVMMQPSLSSSSLSYIPDMPYSGTLNTISETPYLGDDEDQMPSTLGHDQSYSTGLLPSQPTFSTVSYPANPNLNVTYTAYGGSLYHSADDWTPNPSAPYPPLPVPQARQSYTNVAPLSTRHVSQSYVNYPTSGTSVPYPAPRSFSSSCVPMLPAGMDVGGLFPAPAHGTASAPASTILPSNEQMHSTAQRHHPYQHAPSASLDMPGGIGPMRTPTRHFTQQTQPVPSRSTVSEGEETPRKSRARYPLVGKRLRPGPKPKPKTPKKATKTDPTPRGQTQSDGDSAPVDSAAQIKPEAIAGLAAAAVGAPVATKAPAEGSSLSPPPSNDAVPQGIPLEGGIQTVGLPKAFLESLYTGFLTVQGSSSGQPVKRYRCLIDGCDRNFPRKSAIHSHIQTHLEDKPFLCTAEDCHAAFVRQHDLRRHTRIHSGTKPFPCPCGKGFARGDALMRHRQRGICSGSLVPRRATSP